MNNQSIKIPLTNSEFVWKAEVNGEIKFIPLSEMNDEHLQKAVWSLQNRMNDLHKKMMFQEKLLSKLELEANKRNLELQDLPKVDSKFIKARNKVKLLNK